MIRTVIALMLGLLLAFMPVVRASTPDSVVEFYPGTSPEDALVDADQAPATIRGVATWFDANRWVTVPYPHHMRTRYTNAGIVYYVAAGPALRTYLGWKHWDDHFTVLVTSELTGVQIVAEVVDWCACHGAPHVDDDRLADLSPALFKALGARLSRGVQFITIQVLP